MPPAGAGVGAGAPYMPPAGAGAGAGAPPNRPPAGAGAGAGALPNIPPAGAGAGAERRAWFAQGLGLRFQVVALLPSVTCPRIESRVPASPNPNETIHNEFRFPPCLGANPTGSPHFAPRESGSQSQRRLHVTQPCSSVPHSLVKSPRADACTHGRRHTSLSLKPSHSAALSGDPAGASGLSRRAQGTATGVARRSLRAQAPWRSRRRARPRHRGSCGPRC